LTISRPADPVETFIARWQAAGGSERANYQLVRHRAVRTARPAQARAGAADAADNAYVFERRVTLPPRRRQQFQRLHRLLPPRRLHPRSQADAAAEAQGKVFDDALLRARGQAENYARALPAEEGRPPFLVVVDVGNVIELYAEFSRSGATYTPFPDPRSHRIRLADLRDAAIRARLAAVWLDPLSLDPTRHRPRHARDRRRTSPSWPSRWKAGPCRRDRRRLPHPLPVQHVRRGRRPDSQGQLHANC
jgi:hypothetical protein